MKFNRLTKRLLGPTLLAGVATVATGMAAMQANRPACPDVVDIGNQARAPQTPTAQPRFEKEGGWLSKEGLLEKKGTWLDKTRDWLYAGQL